DQRTDGAAPAGGERRDGRDAREKRFDRSKFKPQPGKPNAEGGRPELRNDRPRDGRPRDDKGKGEPKPALQPRPREERAPRFDPDSPFAKLAALRDQLKK